MSFADAGSAIAVDLKQGYGAWGEAQGDVYRNIEDAVGSAYDDNLVGSDGANDLRGGAGNDILRGNDGNDRLLGEEGDDHLIGGAGSDYLDGGSGSDTAHYNSSDAGLYIDLAARLAYGGHAHGDVLASIENIVGSEAFADTLIGDGGSNGLFGNGGDDGLDGLSVGWVGNAAHGTVWVDGGNAVFQPEANYHGPTSFTYRITDGRGGYSNEVTVSLDVRAVNDAPVAANDQAGSVEGGQELRVAAGTLLGNDFDLDGNGLTVVSVGGGGGGSVRLEGDTIVFLADETFSGAAGFSYTVTDGHGGTASASVAVEVTPKPPDPPDNPGGGGWGGGDWDGSGGGGGGEPVVLDLDGDGIELVGLSESTACFDMDGDGTRDRTGWVTADDGFLVFDVQGDGQVTAYEELVLASWGLPGMSDLEGLAHAFDSDRNGVFDRHDAEWRRFAVWQDLNQDGVGMADEVRSLDEAGITAINLGRSNQAEVVDGNVILGHSTYETGTRGSGMVGDVVFQFVPAGASSGDVVEASNGDPEGPESQTMALGESLPAVAASCSTVAAVPCITNDVPAPLLDAGEVRDEFFNLTVPADLPVSIPGTVNDAADPLSSSLGNDQEVGLRLLVEAMAWFPDNSQYEHSLPPVPDEFSLPFSDKDSLAA
ncbi:hypothetical protein [Azospirillum doebereinerae]